MGRTKHKNKKRKEKKRKEKKRKYHKIVLGSQVEIQIGITKINEIVEAMHYWNKFKRMEMAS